MKLYQQLVLFMLAATVLPLAAVGFLLLSRAEAALSERVEAEQRALALSVADGAASEVMKTVDAVARSAELIDWRMASEEETRGGLALLYGQSPELSAVVKVDATGAPLGDAVFAAATGSGHPSFADTQVPSLARAVDVAQIGRAHV